MCIFFKKISKPVTSHHPRNRQWLHRKYVKSDRLSSTLRLSCSYYDQIEGEIRKKEKGKKEKKPGLIYKKTPQKILGCPIPFC